MNAVPAVSDRRLQRRARGMPPLAQGILATLAVLLVLLPAGWFQFQVSERALRDEIRSGLARTARIAASLIDPVQHASFTRPEQEDTPEYAAAIAPWVAARKADPQIAYLYTVIRQGDGFHFIYDVTPKPTDPTAEDQSVAIMELYSPDEVPPELITAWDERKVVVSEDFYYDQWCVDGCIGGYVPFFHANGELAGVVGLDLSSGDYEKRLGTIRRAIGWAGAIGGLLAVLVGVGVWLVRRSDRNTRELERQLDTVNALLNISRALAQKIDVDELLPALISETNAIMRAERCSYFVYDAEGKRLVSRVMQGMDSKTFAVPESTGVIGRVARSRQIQNVPDAYSDPDFDRSFDLVSEFRTRNILAAPVLGEGGKLLGVVQIINKIGARQFDEDDEILLEALTSQMQMAFERAMLTEAYVEKRRLDSALRLASNIQMSMLPTDFPQPGSGPFDLHAILIPAKDVGGDFYDFFRIDDTRWCFVIADVSGKGIPAALFMAKTKALVKAFMGIDPRPDRALALANNELAYDNAAAMFVTVFVAVMDVVSGELVYSNAGHNPPYLLDGAGGHRLLTEADGVPIGAMMDLEFAAATTRIAPGEELFLFTDGVNEAMDPHNEQWGDERLTEHLLQIAELPMQAQNESIVAAVRAHANGAEQSDDITVLALRRAPQRADQAS